MIPNKLNEIMDKRRISNFQLSVKALVSTADISQFRNGKKPCFPAWRRRISNALEMDETDLFPEYREIVKEE